MDGNQDGAPNSGGVSTYGDFLLLEIQKLLCDIFT